MCYKVELQNKNEKKLLEMLENIHPFISKYFLTIRSKSGAIEYWYAIRNLFLWLMDKRIIERCRLQDICPNDFCNVDTEDIDIYLNEKERGGLSPSTLETRKNIFKSFWSYLERSNKCKVTQNIVKYVRYEGFKSNNNIVKKLPTEKQLEELEIRIKKRDNSFLRQRNLTIFTVLKNTGIRESELVGLDIGDIHLDKDIPYIEIVGKRHYRKQEARRVYLNKSAIDSIMELIKARNEYGYGDLPFLFSTQKRTRINEKNVISMLKNMSKGEVTPHMLRHYYATVAAKIGGTVFAHQQLGHKSVNTTVNEYANGMYAMKDVLENM